MKLSKHQIKNITPEPGLVIPDKRIFELPEKVLQFGTGVLLRGLPDYFIDKANRNGIFNGRVVVIKSTSKGSTDSFSQQDGLYTHCIKGLENGKKVEETIINSSISRVLSATENWNDILNYAGNPAMQIIISNTTEVGITLTDDDIHLSPPQSFPGKLLAFLYKRYKIFNGTDDSGMIIIPTELITDNGTKLCSILIELARMNKLEDGFISWLQTSNHFCNSLVDRIVPGALNDTDKLSTEKKLGYTDDLMIMSESFRLWAIESKNKKVKEILSFSKVDDGVIIADDIEKFRELKLRVLNGTHTASCALAIFAGFKTVKEAMADPVMGSFIHDLVMQETIPAISNGFINSQEASDFAHKVLDRFRNPFLEHKWLSIAMNYTSKMQARNISLLEKYYSKTGKIPALIVLGFTGYLLFMKQTIYIPEDEKAGYFSNLWASNDTNKAIDIVIANESLWGTDLSILTGFARSIKENIISIEKEGVMPVIDRYLQKTRV